MLRSLGVIIGIPFAIPFVIASFFRRSRPIHPRGLCFAAEIAPIETRNPKLDGFSQKLTGSALVRLSSTIWKRSRSTYELLGVAMRFHWKEGDSLDATSRTQDMLMATVQHIWSLALAPLTTRSNAYFSNNYFSLLPFRVGQLGDVKFRIVPMSSNESDEGDRELKLLNRVAQGHATFTLQIAPDRLRKKWVAIANIRLLKQVSIDQRQLHFSPFHAGQGIKPIGFFNGFRKISYMAAQLSRPPSKLTSNLRSLFHTE